MRIYVDVDASANYVKGEGYLLNDSIYDEMRSLAEEKLLIEREYDFMVKQSESLSKYKGGNYQLMKIGIETNIQAVCKRLNEVKRQMLNLIINDEKFVAMVDLEVYHNDTDDPEYSSFINSMVVNEEEEEL
jgi:hypothetical protein